MKRLIVLLFIICLLPCVNVFASPSYTGTYMFTAGGNDKAKNIDQIEDLINQWFSDEGLLYQADMEYLGKIEEDGSTEGGNFDVFWGDDTHTNGTWLAPELVKYYSVKAGPRYSMYFVDPEITTGLFSTEYELKSKTMSHISFWTNQGSYRTPSPTPEPTTSVLFGLGLLVLVGLNRKT